MGGKNAVNEFVEQKNIVVTKDKNIIAYSDTLIKKDNIDRVSEWEPLRIYAYQVIASNDEAQ